MQGNALLEDKAKAINEDPEGAAWIAELEVNDPSELEGLLDETAYKASVDAE